MSSIDAPWRCTISCEASDPAAGGGRGSGEVTLAEADGGTTLGYTGEMEADGKIGQLGSRLVAGFMRAQIEAFLTRFAALAAEGRLPAASEARAEAAAFADTPPLAPEAPAAVPEAVLDAPPLAGPTPIAPTATPAIPEPATLAAAVDAQPGGRGPVIRVMLVAAIVVAVGVAAYLFMVQPPA